MQFTAALVTLAISAMTVLADVAQLKTDIAAIE